ncbi:MAG: HAD family phosphatase [Clostridia bacterium]|nr:HAD family phosphatase [Clostridia bacterium]
MKYQAVFSDIDGTLLNNAHRVTDDTRRALARLRGMGIPFALVSARSPAAMAPIQQANGFQGPLISFSGALILEEDGTVVHSQGMCLAQVREIITFAESEGLDMAWCLYSARQWLVRDRRDPRVAMEEGIVGLQAENLPAGTWPREDTFYKILCICNPAAAPQIRQKMKDRFPHLSIVPSSEMMLEIMVGGVSKGLAVQRLCVHWGIDPRNAIALGDNYNDLPMLDAVGCPVVMGNAPADIQARFPFVTADNEHDGVARALETLVFSADREP